MVRDLNYFPLDVESNIYGMTKLEFDDKANKILVATSDCRIYCINYCRFKPSTKEVEFTYIPSGAKIISIGSLKRGSNDYVIGITHSLSPSSSKTTTSRDISLASDGYANRQTTYYLNIYASESVSPSFDLDYVAQDCQTLRLRYVPYHLYSTELLSLDSDNQVTRKPIWLLSGGDNDLHAYLEEKPYQSFTEVSMNECFPELANDKQKSIALWVDAANLVRNESSEMIIERLIALGYEDGSVRLYYSRLNKFTNSFELISMSRFDSYSTIIPRVRLFKIRSTQRDSVLRKRMRDARLSHEIDPQDKQLEDLNLLVISSTENCLVFRDVINNGLSVGEELDESQRLDCVTSSTVGDMNIDGFNEILIGTHGKELITYQFDIVKARYVLSDVKILNYPIFSMTILDLTGDCVKDLVILLANGVLIMQTSAKNLIETCRIRVKALLSAIK